MKFKIITEVELDAANTIDLIVREVEASIFPEIKCYLEHYKIENGSLIRKYKNFDFGDRHSEWQSEVIRPLTNDEKELYEAALKLREWIYEKV